MAEDPGIVFSVKELIGRLDGKLDVIMNVLTNKADRADLIVVIDRVGRVENTVAEMHQREVEREAARVAEQTAEEKASLEAKGSARERRDTRRWIVGTFVSIGLLIAAIATIAAMLLH